MLTPRPSGLGGRLRAHFGKVFAAGILVVGPLLVTYFILQLLFDFLDGRLQPVASQIFHRHVPGLGLGLLVLVLYIAGSVSLNVFGKRMVSWGHDAISKAPFIRAIYSTARGVTESVFGEQAQSFKRVVLVQYPTKGIWAMGFLTAITRWDQGNLVAFVYIPHPPTPQAGWLAIFPTEDVLETNLDVQDAMKMIFSVGTIVPDSLKTKPLSLGQPTLARAHAWSKVDGLAASPPEAKGDEAGT